MPTFKSGAFIQQCYSVHPRCLTLEQFTEPDLARFACVSCRLVHLVTVRGVTTRVPVALAAREGPGTNERASDCLARCLNSHGPGLTVREMDVINDWIGLRCAECRRQYDLDVASFETQQR
jgi:hypothetical protein